MFHWRGKKIKDECTEVQTVESIAESLQFDKSGGFYQKSDKKNVTLIEDGPIIKIVNLLLENAVRKNASDIHIEPCNDKIRFRFRIDGFLQTFASIDRKIYPFIVNRIKVMSRLDLAEKRISQDGRIHIKINEAEISLRISVQPSIEGEKIVIRLLNRANYLMSRDELGFSDNNSLLLDKIIKSPNGIILVTGPTGSGKTTTLYSILQELNSIKKNIITVEDPVEYTLDGITQIQINHRTGITFANALRSILRQDPDIILLGEIRDEETAKIAINASVTGHLVLSSIHTNDTLSTISRLNHLGIPVHFIASTVVGIISQRLIRINCKNCKEEQFASDEDMHFLRLDTKPTLYKGCGCEQCGFTGISGLRAIHEIMPVFNEIKKMIEEEWEAEQIITMANTTGMTSLYEGCKKYVLEGLSPIEELYRIAYKMD